MELCEVWGVCAFLRVLYVILSGPLRLCDMRLFVFAFIIIFRVDRCVSRDVIAVGRYVGSYVVLMSCVYSWDVATLRNIVKINGGAIGHFAA